MTTWVLIQASYFNNQPMNLSGSREQIFSFTSEPRLDWQVLMLQAVIQGPNSLPSVTLSFHTSSPWELAVFPVQVGTSVLLGRVRT